MLEVWAGRPSFGGPFFIRPLFEKLSIAKDRKDLHTRRNSRDLDRFHQTRARAAQIWRKEE